MLFAPSSAICPGPVLTRCCLEAGRRYRIEAPGTYSVWRDRWTGLDAYYCFARWRVGPVPQVWAQLLLDDRPMFALAAERGDPTGYQPGHRYETVIAGTGRQLRLQISDAKDSWRDNRRALQVQIFED